MIVSKETDDFTVTYEDNHVVRKKVFDAVIAFYVNHESFDSESICQNDDPIMNAHIILAEIADNIIKFKVDWKD